MAEITQETFNTLDSLLGSVDLSKVSAESTGGFEDLPEGYFLSEVEKAEISVSKTSGAPMVVLQFKVVEDGLGSVVDDYGYAKLVDLEHTKNRKIFKYYPLKDEKTVKKFVTDMLKFEGSEPDTPLLSAEYFTTSEILAEALALLVGLRLYVKIEKTTKDGETTTWSNLISWKRARAVELPVE